MKTVTPDPGVIVLTPCWDKIIKERIIFYELRHLFLNVISNRRMKHEILLSLLIVSIKKYFYIIAVTKAKFSLICKNCTIATELLKNYILAKVLEK